MHPGTLVCFGVAYITLNSPCVLEKCHASALGYLLHAAAIIESVRQGFVKGCDREKRGLR